MPRIRKNPEVRRNEILDAAWVMFLEKGYDAVSVQEIIDSIGVAKGTFYHYFPSKEALLDALVERSTHENLLRAQKTVKAEDLDAISKLNRLFADASHWKIHNAAMVHEIVYVLYKEDNVRLRSRINSKSNELIAPIIAKVFEQGSEEGVFDVEEPLETAEILLMLSAQIKERNIATLLSDDETSNIIEKMERRFNQYSRTVERVIGAPQGCIKIQGKRLFKSLAEAKSSRA